MRKQILTALLLIALVMAVAAGCSEEPSKQPVFPTEGLATALPQLEGTAANITTNTADNFVAEVSGITSTDYKVYVAACKAAGLNKVLTQYDNTVVLSNEEGHMVTVEYEEDKQILSVDLYAPTVLPILDYEDFLGKTNVSGGYVVADLKLPKKLKDKKADIELNLTWTSSFPGMINEKGELIRPLTGDMVVILTATDESGAKKSFPVRVLGMDTNKGTLTVTKDLVPATGVGVEETFVQTFVFNTSNNSIIADLGEKQKVNYVKLTDSDNVAFLGTEFLTLWVSDDNVTYTQIKEYSLIQLGADWYLYGFETEARYVKAHYTLLTSDRLHKDNYSASLPNEGEFKNVYGEIIRAGYEEVVGGNGAEFTKSTYTVTNNSERKWCDFAYTVPLADLGVTGNADTLRIFADGKPLYHYVDGINAVIRIPNLDKGASLTVEVLQSESNIALNFANKQSVYEIVYGTREVTCSRDMVGTSKYTLRLYKGTKFPDGSVLEEDIIIGSDNAMIYQSTDGGYSWTIRAPFRDNPSEGGKPVVNQQKGEDISFLLDEFTGRIYGIGCYPVRDEFCFDGNTREVIGLMYSDDGGLTWNDGPFLPKDPSENILNWTTGNYWNGITVKSSYDGKDGPGVDLLISTIAYNGAGIATGGTVRVAYSCDAGETWQFSDTNINYRKMAETEGDMSETTVIERDDGVLVMQSRCQHQDLRTFSVSYSFDHGVTWMSQAELSNVYSSNTQPISAKFEVAGVEATMLSWASNNVNGCTYFYRNPMHIGTTTNGGEIFRNIQNLLARTPYEWVDSRLEHLFATNQCFTKSGDDDMYMQFNCYDLREYSGEQVRMQVLVTDFDNWLTRTKGAYDSFENGLAVIEGWSGLRGASECTDEQVSQGNYSLKLKNGAEFFRSIPYFQNGKLSLDVFVDEETEFTMELQSALSLKKDNKAAPIVYTVKDKKLSFAGGDVSIDLKDGWNTLTFQLELTEDKAMISVNGAEAVAIPVDMSIGDYITFVAIYCEATAYIDEFLVVSDLDPVLVATEEDKQAADVVIEQIKKMDATNAAEVQAARAAFEALTQVQQDFVDSKMVVDPNGDINTPDTFVNYYDVLVAAEAKLAG